MSARISVDFPNLAKHVWAQCSPVDPTYNCIAFAAGRSDVYWWPDNSPDEPSDYWPTGLPRDETIDALRRLIESFGYAACADGSLEPGIEKVAPYAIGEVPTHAARQLENGNWISKLGPREDIRNDEVEALDGPAYGHVVRYLRWPRTTSTEFNRS